MFVHQKPIINADHMPEICNLTSVRHPIMHVCARLKDVDSFLGYL